MTPRLVQRLPWLLVACVWCVASGSFLQAEHSEPEAAKVDQLVRQLNDPDSAQREEAEHALLEMAPEGTSEELDHFLNMLPRPKPGMPEQVQQRLRKIRLEIETRQAEKILSVTRFSLSADGMSLSDVFDKIDSQTGNKLSDHREQFGQEFGEATVTLDLENEEFWSGLDQVLDQVELEPYSLSGEETLAIVNREPGMLPRQQRGSYAGPFRVEAVSIFAKRNLRNPAEESARVELEIAWEPRLRPIALTQSLTDLRVKGDDGEPIPTTSSRATLNVEVPTGSHSAELVIPLDLPSREVSKIASFRGSISALVPGRQVKFKFDNLDKALGAEQQQGGVKVTVDRVHKNHGLWEVYMRMELLSDDPMLNSQRGWIFQNITYMVGKDGAEIDHAGFETTRENEREIGMAYFFELPDDDIGAYSWVYRSPASIIQVPVAYELNDLPLP